MPGLLDIAKPMDAFVDIRGTKIPCYGITSIGIALLLERFPVMRELMTGRTPKLDAASLFTLVPYAIASIIVCGTAKPVELADLAVREQMEAVAADLSAEEQLDILEKVIGLTMPKGVGPFVERVMALFGADMAKAGTAAAALSNTADTKSPPASKS